MIDFELIDPHGPFDEACLKSRLDSLRADVSGAELEDYYLDVMRYCNGGNPVLRVFDVNSICYVLVGFFAYTPTGLGVDPDSIPSANIANAEAELEAAEAPAGLYPIGLLWNGDYLCFDFRVRAVFPPVVIWQHEMRDQPDEVVFVSDSFREYCDLLH